MNTIKFQITEPKVLEIIEKDSDTPEDKSDNFSLYPYDLADVEIDIREDKWSVFEFVRKFDKKKIIVDPEFQRNFVWSEKQQSQFIESIILGLPLPAFYLNQTKEGKYLIVDGRQRTTTIVRFLENELTLTELEALPKFNGLDFNKISELNDKIQTRIEDKQLTIYLIPPSAPTKVVYDIFNRINTNGTQLNRQEVRNCIYIGESTKLLKELSETQYFKRAISNGVSPKRMKDREYVLRYLSFNLLDYRKDYNEDMSAFVEETMILINQFPVIEINKLKLDFERVMKTTYDFFGINNFRLPNEEKRGLLNIAIMESVGNFFSSKSADFLNKHKTKIISNYNILTNNADYKDAVQRSTNNKTRVFTRFRLAHEILGKV